MVLLAASSEVNAKANAENRARIKQYKQQMLIRNVRDQQRFGIYNTKKVGYEQSLKSLDAQFAAKGMQDELRMNELLKGSKLASQNKLVNEVQAAGTSRCSWVQVGHLKPSYNSLPWLN